MGFFNTFVKGKVFCRDCRYRTTATDGKPDTCAHPAHLYVPNPSVNYVTGEIAQYPSWPRACGEVNMGGNCRKFEPVGYAS